ncbi:MAG: MFS transporter [Planctomycetaceae bacterium]
MSGNAALRDVPATIEPAAIEPTTFDTTTIETAPIDAPPFPPRVAPGRAFGRIVLRFPYFRRMLARMPLSCRPALYFDSLANLGTGGLMALFSISLVVQATILNAPLWQQSLLGMLFFASSLFSPIVTWVGRKVPMQLLVVVPNVIVAGLLFLVAAPWGGPLAFTLLVGASFWVRSFPRVAEMNMIRVRYPASHRGTAIGWTQALSALSGLSITFLSWGWFALWPAGYAGLYWIVGGMVLLGAMFYNRIPVSRRNIFAAGAHQGAARSPLAAFLEGARVFFADRRFLHYQGAFAVAGIANHIGLVLIPHVLKESIGAGNGTVAFVAAVLPALLIVASSPVWGRYLDGKNPMTARAIFNGLQLVAYVFYTIGGLLGNLPAMIVGTIFHAISNGGGNINWLTGSLHFARPEHVRLYNGIHVFLTGLRGLIGPMGGLILFATAEQAAKWRLPGLGLGSWVFAIAAALSLGGMLWMIALQAGDAGPQERLGRK